MGYWGGGRKLRIYPTKPTHSTPPIVLNILQAGIGVGFVKCVELRGAFWYCLIPKAFRCALVPQNRDDEPAKVLLERIQAGTVAFDAQG